MTVYDYYGHAKALKEIDKIINKHGANPPPPFLPTTCIGYQLSNSNRSIIIVSIEYYRINQLISAIDRIVINQSIDISKRLIE